LSLDSSFLHRAGCWFLASGIVEPSGGVARYRHIEQKRNLPVSTEITGYAVSTFSYLYRRTGEQKYLDASVHCAQFLTRQAWNPDLQTFPFETAPGSPAYFFDCGIIVRGILSVYRLTHDREILNIAQQAGRTMARDFLTPAAIHPVIALPSREPLPYEKRWSREPGCFLLKSAMAWKNLGMELYWRTALKQALTNDPPFLPGAAEPEKIMDRLHAYCYYLEGLLAEPGCPECAAALRIGIPRTAGYLHEIAPQFARSDVYAQLLRIRFYADAFGIQPMDRVAAEQEAAAIASFQYTTNNSALNGGFCFGRRAGHFLPFVNPVSSAFSLQALDLWSQYCDGKFKPDLDALI